MTVGVCYGCPLSPVLFNIFFSRTSCRIYSTTTTPLCLLEGCLLCNLYFADDISLIAGSNSDFIDKLANSTNTWDGDQPREVKGDGEHCWAVKKEIHMNDVQPQEVQSFKHLGIMVCQYGSCMMDIHFMITAVTAGMARLSKKGEIRKIIFVTKTKAAQVPCHPYPAGVC